MKSPRAFFSLTLVAALGGGGVGLLSAGTVDAGVAGATVATCHTLTDPGTAGLTAADIVSARTGAPAPGSTITASGCDVGIYVSNSVSGVTITDVTVTGAEDAGILAESTSALTITKSTIKGNGLASNPAIPQAFGISLFGVSTSTVSTDHVTGNGRGGIGIMDNGPFDPGAIQPQTHNTPAKVPAAAESKNDTVSHNTVSTNAGGCAIVVAPFNTKGTVSTISISTNSVTGRIGPLPAGGVNVGGIVTQSNGATSSVDHVVIKGNTVKNSVEGGIIVHAAAPGSSTNTVQVMTNPTVSGNNWGLSNGPTATVGVVVGSSGAPGTANNGTVVSGNTIKDQHFGVWTTPGTKAEISNNTISVIPGGTPIYVVPAPGTGYTEVAADGAIVNYGSAGFYGSMRGHPLNAPVVGLATTEDQGGYWEVASDGGVFSFGDAVFKGSVGGQHLNAPVVGIAGTPFVSGPSGTTTPGGLGYWEVASDGGVFAFGDAAFYGSMGGQHLNSPVVGIASTPDGHGYWEVASDGGVFAFGDAAFYGSIGGQHLNAPVVGIASTPDGHGYWEVASDGGVFAFGDAAFYGSIGGQHLNAPVVGIASTPDGHGYWEVASDGGVFTFGDAASFGSAGGEPLTHPVVGMSALGITKSGA